MSLLVPAAVERENLIARAELEHARHVREFTRLLKDIDPRLELVFINRPPGVEVDPPAGMVWDRYHVQIKEPTRDIPDFIPITGPNGEFMEPHSGVFEQLKEQWLGDEAGRERFRARRLEQARQKEKAAEESRRELREDIQDRLRSLFDTSVHFGGRGWTAQTAGRRGRS
jgi:hypothetical protein